MAINKFIEIDGIPGESSNDAHKNWIEVIEYFHKVSQPTTGSTSSSGARTAERADHGSFIIVKPIDKASPKIALSCCKGEHIDKITFHLCNDTGKQETYLEVVMSNVVVTSFETVSGKRYGDTVPVEEVSLNYGKIEWTYTVMDHGTGKSQGDVKTHWDVLKNTGG